MDERQLDQVVAACLEDIHRRRALGEAPDVLEYRNKAGDAYALLADVLDAEAAIDRIIDVGPSDAVQFPQPFGEHTLLRELGRGAMGVVYEAVHRPLGRKVALKVLRTGFDTESSALERFRREARACAQVQHDHIVEIHDAGEVDGRPYYSMKLLEGRPLDEVARDATPLDPVELCRGLAGVADALTVLHDAGIVHRDVKPSNVIVRDDGVMVLADFGLARTVTSERLTATGQALGTPLYMSPEQVRGQGAEIDGRADVYGLGATLYEAVTGRQLFEAKDLAAMLRMVLQERPAPLRDLRPDVPEDCERIALKALEKRKEDRYQTAAEFRDDLLAFAAGGEVKGRPVSTGKRVARRAAPWFPAMAAAVALIAGSLYWAANRPATLEVRTFPAAEASVGDGPWKPTPFTVSEMAPGEHVVAMRLPGFEATTETLYLDPGERRTLQRVLIAAQASADDPAVLRRLAQDLGIEIDEMRVEMVRGSKGSRAFQPLFPVGKVRREDVEQGWALAVSRSGYVEGGEIVFMKGEEVLHREKFDPEAFGVSGGALPQEVRAALAPGVEITWGHAHANEDATRTVTFRLGTDAEERALDAALERVREHCASQPDQIAQNLHVQLLLKDGFDVAAYREARKCAEVHPDSGRAWAAQQTALRRMGLEGTPPWTELLGQLGAQSPETLEAWDRIATGSE